MKKINKLYEVLEFTKLSHLYKQNLGVHSRKILFTRYITEFGREVFLLDPTPP